MQHDLAGLAKQSGERIRSWLERGKRASGRVATFTLSGHRFIVKDSGSKWSLRTDDNSFDVTSLSRLEEKITFFLQSSKGAAIEDVDDEDGGIEDGGIDDGGIEDVDDDDDDDEDGEPSRRSSHTSRPCERPAVGTNVLVKAQLAKPSAGKFNRAANKLRERWDSIGDGETVELRFSDDVAVSICGIEGSDPQVWVYQVGGEEEDQIKHCMISTADVEDVLFQIESWIREHCLEWVPGCVTLHEDEPEWFSVGSLGIYSTTQHRALWKLADATVHSSSRAEPSQAQPSVPIYMDIVGRLNEMIEALDADSAVNAWFKSAIEASKGDVAEIRKVAESFEAHKKEIVSETDRKRADLQTARDELKTAEDTALALIQRLNDESGTAAPPTSSRKKRART